MGGGPSGAGTRGWPTTAWLMLVTGAFPGCAADAPAPAAVEVADSAGVRIVTNTPDAVESAEAWSLAETPAVEIGAGAAPETPLQGVVDLSPLVGGRVAVALSSPPRVLVLDATGTLLATLGGRGDGPGEFLGLSSVAPLAGDSVAVWDPTRRRMSVFTHDGVLVREVSLDTLAPGPRTDLDSPSGSSLLLPAGPEAFFLFGIGFMDSRRGIKRVEAPSYRIGTDGEELARYGPFPGWETYLTETGAGFVIFGASPLGLRIAPRRPATPDAASLGDTLLVGTAEEPELEVYGPEGRLRRIIRWPGGDRSVSDVLLERWDAYLDEGLSPLPEGRRGTIRDFMDEQVPRAERVPAYADVLVSETGEVWVGGYAGQVAAPGVVQGTMRVPPRQWLVFDREGRLRARLETPAGFQPFSVREGRVWGVYRDDLDVESVRAYEVVRPGS